MLNIIPNSTEHGSNIHKKYKQPLGLWQLNTMAPRLSHFSHHSCHETVPFPWRKQSIIEKFDSEINPIHQIT